MKNLPVVIIIMFMVASCNSKSDANTVHPERDTINHSYTFNGVFGGVTPCADCPGIKTVVEFTPDSIFYETLDYLERDGHYKDSGTWHVLDSIITVTYNKDDNHRFFKLVNDSTIRLLDMKKQEISGEIAPHFILKRLDTVLPR